MPGRLKRDTDTRNRTNSTQTSGVNNSTLNTELIEISQISFRVAMASGTQSDYVNATNTPAKKLLFARMTIYTTIAFVCTILLIGIYIAHRHGTRLRQKTIWQIVH